MNKKIKILSLGWRSHWLANKLKSLGFAVELYEITEHAGWSHPEDIDGPFPFSISADSPEDFVNLSQSSGALLPLEDGFCFSSPDGNFSYESPCKDLFLHQSKRQFKKDYPLAKSFWFDDFLKSFSKSRFKRSSDWALDVASFDISSPIYIRTSERSTYHLSLEILKDRGVCVDSVSSSNLPAILKEVKSKSSDWIVALTISELKILTLNEVEGRDGQLGWNRKRFFYDSGDLSALPKWSVWLDSYVRPWKEDNLYIIIKGQHGKYIDLWSLEPVYNQEVKIKSLKHAKNFLENKFSFMDFEAQQSENLEGALKTFFPVTSFKKLVNDTSYIWNSPLEWGSYSMESAYEYQSILVKNIYSEAAGNTKTKQGSVDL